MRLATVVRDVDVARDRARNGPALYEALAEARRGGAVFPLRGKQPIAKGYNCRFPNCNDGNHLHATCDPAEVARWFEQDPGINYGVLPENYFVADWDLKHGGLDTRSAMQREHGPWRTQTVRTGGGGLHERFRLPPGHRVRGQTWTARQKTSGSTLGLDIIGQYGSPQLFVGVGSVHPATSAVYQWEPGCSPEDVAIADAPTWLVGLLSAEGLLLPVEPRHTAGSAARSTRVEVALLDRPGSLRSGNEIRYRCFEHDDHVASASYSTEKHVWYCHGCNKAGKQIDLLRSLGLWTKPTTHVQAELDHLVALIDRYPWRGVAGATDRRVLHAHCRIIEKAGRTEGYGAGQRELAELAGVHYGTVSRSHHRLRSVGVLIMHDCTCGRQSCVERRGSVPWHTVEASRWTFRPEALQAATVKYCLSPKETDAGCNGVGVLLVGHDAFRWQALGPNGERLLNALARGPWPSAAAWAREAGVSTSTLTRKIQKLVACGAAVKVEDGWRRGPATLDEIAQRLGTAGRASAQRELHDYQRKVYRRQFAEGRPLVRTIPRTLPGTAERDRPNLVNSPCLKIRTASPPIRSDVLAAAQHSGASLPLAA